MLLILSSTHRLKLQSTKGQTRRAISEESFISYLDDSKSQFFSNNNKVSEPENFDCSSELKLYNKKLNRTRIAISSFPGSGNTWARHLIHMATGYWTGNRRSSKVLKEAGWLGEDLECKDAETIVQKTHRLNKNQGKLFKFMFEFSRHFYL